MTTEVRTVVIRRATLDDFNVVLDILNEAATWLQNKGIRQWPASFDAGGFRARSIAARIELGTVYVAEIEQQVTATIGVDDEADPDFWNIDEPACYIHRMAVSRSHAGSGIGQLLLTWASDRAYAAEAQQLRLDCAKNNEALQTYYRVAGFTQLDTIDIGHRTTGARFQKETQPMSIHEPIEDLTRDTPIRSQGRPMINQREALTSLQKELESRRVPHTKFISDDDGARLQVIYSARFAEIIVIIDGAFAWGWYLDRWHEATDPAGAAAKITDEYYNGDETPIPSHVRGSATGHES